MVNRKLTYRRNLFVKRAGSCFMIALLILLTGMNFLVYGGDGSNRVANVWSWADEDRAATDSNPAGPDEKPSSNPVSFVEEYVHEASRLTDPFWTNFMARYRITGAGKLHLVHFDIISPPPDLV